MSGLVLALDVRMRYVDADGVPTGPHIGLLNPVSFTIETPEPERTPRVSKLRDSFGQALDELVVPQPQTIGFTTDETGDAEVLAWAMNGQASNYSQSAATVANQTTAVVKGEWLKLPHKMISDVAIEPSGGGTPFEDNVDYLVDPKAGMIKITEGGAIASGNVDLSYSAAAVTGKRIGSGSRPSIQVRIEGEGTNLANGKPVSILVRRANLSASGSLDFTSDDWVQTVLTGTPLRVGVNDPVEVDLQD